ncbi:MAG: alpha/beta fold hydrolase [Gammaproteobacteria bacterium]
MIMPTDPQAITLTAADGYRLGALRYPPDVERRGRLIIAGATAVPQHYYARFAAVAAQRGLETWTLDYRGVGQSAPPTLRGFRMNYFDWAELDLAALIDHLTGIDREPLLMVGHSYGGHALGLLPNHDRVQRMATFATGAGWHGWMPPLERLRVMLLWRVIGPLLVHSRGYLAWNTLGLGENLPRDIFYQWRRWCAWPRYFFEDPELPDLAQRFLTVRTSIRAINAADDNWAMPASRDAFMAAYANAPVELITVKPGELGMKTIGHMGYFRPAASLLWQNTLDWLQSDSSNQTR